VIDRLAADLKNALPEMEGFSPRNLFGEAARRARLWYAERAVKRGWSRTMLSLHIEGRLHDREGLAVTNFAGSLPPPTSDLAQQATRDPYLFDFLTVHGAASERAMEDALVTHIERFLLELGAGFAFVGRQYHLEVGGDDCYIDLLFDHLKLRCFVVIELKARPFDAGDVGQLNLYHPPSRVAPRRHPRGGPPGGHPDQPVHRQRSRGEARGVGYRGAPRGADVGSVDRFDPLSRFGPAIGAFIPNDDHRPEGTDAK
jgi:predicted nuclease of restriction endonuclease-like (RecB) superfamily